jgi:hypothetical protein
MSDSPNLHTAETWQEAAMLANSQARMYRDLLDTIFEATKGSDGQLFNHVKHVEAAFREGRQVEFYNGLRFHSEA